MTKRRAFFFLGRRRDGSFEGYPHLALVLAEGLVDSGWVISSDVRYWQTEVDGDYIFPGDGLEMVSESDLVVFSEDYFMLTGTCGLPKIMSGISAPSLYLDRSDLGYITKLMFSSELKGIDLILRCHSNRWFRYPNNVRPTVFGISHRIAAACVANPNPTRAGVMWNFRHTRFPHSVRVWAEKHVRPLLESKFEIDSSLDPPRRDAHGYEELMLRQTGGRHATRYFENLSNTLVCACFGGWFVLPLHHRPEGGLISLFGRRLLRSIHVATSVVAQWDSWRLWEAFAAGATVLHLDFEKHGFLTGDDLPIPMEHYIAVDTDNPLKSLLPIIESTEDLKRIGEAGAKWALKRYRSDVIAKRVLSALGQS